MEAQNRTSILYAHRAFMRAALAVTQAFAWVISFHYFFETLGTFSGALVSVLFVYITSQVVTIVLTPISGAGLRGGFRPLMAFGVLAFAGASMAFGAGVAQLSPSFSVLQGIVFFAVLFGAYRALYWIPYGISMSGHRAKRPFTRFASELLIATLPFAAGVIMLLPFGMATVFLSGGVLALLALPFLGAIRNRKERYVWGFSETFKQLFYPRYRSLVLNAFVSGIESAALFLVWPLAIFLIVGQRYDALGAILSGTLLALLCGRVIARHVFKRKTRFEPTPAIEASVVFSAWVLRLVAAVPIAIVVVDTFYHLGAPKRFEHPYVHGGYEQAGDSGTYVDELSALKEIGLAFGRIALAFVVLSFAFSTPALALGIPVFIAACAAALSVVLARTPAPASY